MYWLRKISKIMWVLMGVSVLASCGNPFYDPNPRPRSERLTLEDYSINTYQPPCQLVTMRNGYGAVVSQYQQCPPVQYICHLKATGTRIPCPRLSMAEIWQDVEHQKARFDEEECRMIEQWRKDPNLQNELDSPLLQPLDSNKVCGKAAQQAQKSANTSNKPQPQVWKSIALNGHNQQHHQQNTYIATAASRDEAVRQAMQQCQRGEKVGNDCQTWQTFSNICLAFHEGKRNNKSFYYAGAALNQQEAEKLALQSCQKRAKDCRMAMAAVCALPCDPASDNRCVLGKPVSEGIQF